MAMAVETAECPCSENGGKLTELQRHLAAFPTAARKPQYINKPVVSLKHILHDINANLLFLITVKIS